MCASRNELFNSLRPAWHVHLFRSFVFSFGSAVPIDAATMGRGTSAKPLSPLSLNVKRVTRCTSGQWDSRLALPLDAHSPTYYGSPFNLASIYRYMHAYNNRWFVDHPPLISTALALFSTFIIISFFFNISTYIFFTLLKKVEHCFI